MLTIQVTSDSMILSDIPIDAIVKYMGSVELPPVIWSLGW